MKTLKTIAALLLAATIVGTASAQVNLKVTGSTAFRNATYFGIVDSLNSPTAAAIGGTATNLATVTQAVIVGTGKTGTAYAGQTVTVQCAFAGSSGGLAVTTSNTIQNLPGTTFDENHTWLSASNISGGALTINPGAGTITGFTNVTSSGAAFDAAALPLATLADSLQSTTPYKTPALLQENSGGIGVLELNWVKGNNQTLAGYSRLTNMTSIQADLLLSAGELPLSLFTGNASDSGVDVVLVGRNNDSGSRLETEANAYSSQGPFGYGFSTENQYQPTFDGSGNINGVTNVGDAGYEGGGLVATALKTVVDSGSVDDAGNPFIFVGYVGTGDKNTVLGVNSTALLTYDGSPSTDVAVQLGQYSFWFYEHLYYRSGLTTNQVALIDNISSQIRLTDAIQSGPLLTSMTVSRSSEGAIVSP